jgi:hypothetical protein
MRPAFLEPVNRGSGFPTLSAFPCEQASSQKGNRGSGRLARSCIGILTEAVPPLPELERERSPHRLIVHVYVPPVLRSICRNSVRERFSTR